MTKAEAKTLTQGEKLFVSYKGIRPCTFKNLKGNCAFVVFDNGNGEGLRLHRVLATTLLRSPKPAQSEKTAEPSKQLTDEQLLRALADRLGFDIIAR